jgi:hypothetical protein
MELKVEFNESNLQEAALRATILKGTVNYLLSVLTPETLRVFLEKTLADSVKGIASYEIQNAMKPHYEKIILEYVALPEVKARLEVAIKSAVDGSVAAYPATVQAFIADTAKKSFMEALQSKIKYG